jgi:hypothetical protein
MKEEEEISKLYGIIKAYEIAKQQKNFKIFDFLKTQTKGEE